MGHPKQLAIQALAVVTTVVYSGVATFVVLKVVNAIVPIRAGRTDEGLGMDVSQHGEEAYADGEGAILVLPDAGVTNASALATSASAGVSSGGRS
jgi:Amt family ammonium transporter